MAKVASLKILKNLDNSDKSLVFGYVRKVEKELQMISIPALIFYKILGYFYLHEYFAKGGDDLEISDDKLTVSAAHHWSGWGFNNAYGNLWFKSTGNEIATWKFRIDSPGISPVGFGIVSKDDRLNEDAANALDKPLYFVSPNGNVIKHYGEGTEHVEASDYALQAWYKHEFELEIELNTKCKTIKWRHMKSDEDHDEELQPLFMDIQQSDSTEYKILVSIRQRGDIVSLIDFKSRVIS